MKLAKLYDFLALALLPFWGGLALFRDVMIWRRTRRLLMGDTEKAWTNCSQIWQNRDFLSIEPTGLSPILPFENGLAMAWFKYQPKSKSFLIEQIHSQDPLLAAYAFKALSRFPLERKDLSAHLFRSEELVPILSIDDNLAEISLGQFISGWFNQHNREQTKTSHVRTSVALGGSHI